MRHGSSSPLSFINQDLRSRAFRHRALRGALFSGCDLRGCDFQAADLQGARFVNCRTGRVPGRIAIAVAGLLVGAIATAHAISSMVLGARGTSPDHPAWPYVVALQVALAIATLGTTLWLSPALTPVGYRITGTATAALVGFFYGGRLTDNNPGVAIATAVVLALAGFGVTTRWRTAEVEAMVASTGAIATYGLTFALWTAGSDALTTGRVGVGCICLGAAISGIGITVRSVAAGWQATTRIAITNFRRALLNDSIFDGTDVTHCDGTDAIQQP